MKAQIRFEASTWCSNLATNSAQAVRELFGLNATLLYPDQMFSQIFAEAQAKASQCPYRLGGPTNIPLLYTLTEYTQVQLAIETGVAYGWSTLIILLSLRNRSNSKLISVDKPYEKYHNESWVGVVVPKNLQDKWSLLRMPDRDGLPTALQAFPFIDLAHYDSDKTHQGRLWAYNLIWPSLRQGGILISDDVGDNFGFREFCAQVGKQPIIVADGKKFQGVLVK